MFYQYEYWNRFPNRVHVPQGQEDSARFSAVGVLGVVALYNHFFSIHKSSKSGRGNTDLLLDSHFGSAGCGEKATGLTWHRSHTEDMKGTRN